MIAPVIVGLLALAGLAYYVRVARALPPIESDRLRFGIGDLLLGGGLAGWFALNGVAALGHSMVITRSVLVFSSLLSASVFIMVLSAMIVGGRNPIRLLGLAWHNPARGALVTFLSLAAVYPVIMVSLLVAGAALGPNVAPQEMVVFLQKAESPSDRLLVIFLATVVAPLTEELLFRGYVQRIVHRYAGRWSGIAVSAGLFALSHGHLGVLAGLFLLAVALSLVYDRTGSLWSPILMHATFNAITVSVALLWPELIT